MTQPPLRELIYRLKQESKITTMWLLPSLLLDKQNKIHKGKLELNFSQILVRLCSHIVSVRWPLSLSSSHTKYLQSYRKMQNNSEQISSQHYKWFLREHNYNLSASLAERKQVIIHHKSSYHLSAVHQPASFYIFITTAPV